MNQNEVIVRLPDKNGRELRLQLIMPIEEEGATVSLMDMFSGEEVELLPEQARRMAGALNFIANMADHFDMYLETKS